MPDEHIAPLLSAPAAAVTPSPYRAWRHLVWLSIKRQARAHLMVWIALGLLAFTLFVVWLNAQAGRFSMDHWRFPRRAGPYYWQFFETLIKTQTLARDVAGNGVFQAATGSIRATLDHSAPFFVFSNWVVFSVFTTFLLPLWSLSFATEGLGREREAGNLIWVLTRPLSRPAIFLAKYVSILPWCLALNLGGFWLLCLAAGEPGRRAFDLYWPAVLAATFAFCALFHMLAAWVKRPAVVAILYAFFLETIFGNLPGHLKRFSISFYTRCIMFERAHQLHVQPERPAQYLPVAGTTAWWILAGATALCLLVGMLVFSRREYLT
jgi:ABC-type transport system involved in multi-copper enzyme maturation permease subunit